MQYQNKYLVFLAKEPIYHYLAIASFVTLFIVHILCVIYLPYLNHDVAQYLTAGQMLSGGAIPYVDIIDTNPPVIIYLSFIPAMVAKLSNISLAVCGLLFYFFWVLLSGVAFSKALSWNVRLSVPQRYLVWTFWLCLSLWSYRRGNFGQREQLLFMSVSPFILLRQARYSGKQLEHGPTVWLAILAAISLAMKPFYALAIGMTELVFVVCRKRFRAALFAPEMFVLVAIGILYLTHFLLVPGMSSFYTQWLSFLSRGYAAYNIDLYVLMRGMFHTIFLAYLCGLVLLCVLPALWPSMVHVLAGAFGWFALGAVLLYVWQQKGWEYQLIPFYLSISTAFFILALGFLQKYVDNVMQLRATGLLALLLLFLSNASLFGVTRGVLRNTPFRFPSTRYTEVITMLTKPEERVLFVHTSVGTTFPALTYTGRLYGGRFLCTYPLAFIFHDSYDYVVPDQWQEEENVIYNMLMEDVLHLRPRLVFVRAASGGQALPAYFKISTYLKQRGFYQTALANYIFLGYTGPFEVYFLPQATNSVSDGYERGLPAETIRSLEKKNLLRQQLDPVSGAVPLSRERLF